MKAGDRVIVNGSRETGKITRINYSIYGQISYTVLFDAEHRAPFEPYAVAMLPGRITVLHEGDEK